MTYSLFADSISDCPGDIQALRALGLEFRGMHRIPGDQGHPWRLNKFVEYQAAVPPIGPATYLCWAKKYRLDDSTCIALAWYNSTCYCEVTALHMLENLHLGADPHLANLYWRQYKELLVFNSARKYAKSLDWFAPMMAVWAKQTDGNPARWIDRFRDDDPRAAYSKLECELRTWPFMGRFSVELFADAAVQLSREGLIRGRFEAPRAHWSDGANTTSGMLNMFYQDLWADDYDHEGALPSELSEALDRALEAVQGAIRAAYPAQDVSPSVITPKMCSWRNLFKGTRYAGFHHDRQLEILRGYERDLPHTLWGRVFELRRESFDGRLLGELGGWYGIRPLMKQLWLKYGLTGAEGLAPPAGALESRSAALPLAQEAT